MRSDFLLNQNRGFSLVELVVSQGIVVIIFAAVLGLQSATFSSSDNMQVSVEADVTMMQVRLLARNRRTCPIPFRDSSRNAITFTGASNIVDFPYLYFGDAELRPTEKFKGMEYSLKGNSVPAIAIKVNEEAYQYRLVSLQIRFQRRDGKPDIYREFPMGVYIRDSDSSVQSCDLTGPEPDQSDDVVKKMCEVMGGRYRADVLSADGFGQCTSVKNSFSGGFTMGSRDRSGHGLLNGLPEYALAISMVPAYVTGYPSVYCDTPNPNTSKCTCDDGYLPKSFGDTAFSGGWYLYFLCVAS